MAWLKIQNVGDTATVVVKSCGEAPGKLGPQVRFDSEQGESIYLPLTIGQYWLSELGFAGNNGEIDYNKVRGSALKFSRVPAPNADDRPHWKVQRLIRTSPESEPVAKLNEHLPPAGAAREVPPDHLIGAQRKAEARAQIADAYVWAHKIVSDQQHGESKKRKGGCKPTADSIERGVTTLMLRAERMNAI